MTVFGTRLRLVACVTAGAALAVGATALGAGLVIDQMVRDAGRADLVVGGDGAVAPTVAFVAAWVSAGSVGAILLVRRPAHPIGWLFAALATSLAAQGLSESYATYGLYVKDGSAPGIDIALVVANTNFVVVLALIGLTCSLTPDGRFLSNRWRVASHVMVAASTAWIFLRIIGSEPLQDPFFEVPNPAALTSVDLGPVRMVAATLNNALVLAAAVSLFIRFRRARGEARRQLMWIVVAAVPVAPLMVLAFVSAYAGYDRLLIVAFIGIVVPFPIGAALAVTRAHLYDVDRILSRALTYVTVTAAVLATYIVSVFAVARAVGEAADRSATATTIATLLAIGAARPLYIAVRDLVDRHFQRRRYEALCQVRSFVADPGAGGDVQSLLRQALGDGTLHVAYWQADTAQWITAAGGATIPTPDALPVKRAGRLVAAVSTVADNPSIVRAVLDAAAPELDNAGLRAATAVQLQEIRASRERIAKAQIDERRRIERDLHDGAQQRLLGAAAQMQAALLNGTTERLRDALELGIRESRHTVEELRALANGLHPSALDDGGLSTAFEDLASRLPISIAVSNAHRRYPAIVESTMWFVACEAVANAAKHADPRSIVLALDDLGTELSLVIEDDGIGGADPAGSGLRGIADRVEAAGGRFTIVSGVCDGTRVEAVLPCVS